MRSIGVVFLNGAMLSLSDKYDSVNERTQEISELMKLHIQGVWQNAHKFIRATGSFMLQRTQSSSSSSFILILQPKGWIVSSHSTWQKFGYSHISYEKYSVHDRSYIYRHSNCRKKNK